MTSVNFENDYLWQRPWNVNFLQYLLFLKKTAAAEAHLFCKFNAHRSAWLQSKTIYVRHQCQLFIYEALILGWLPLLTSFNNQLITDIHFKKHCKIVTQWLPFTCTCIIHHITCQSRVLLGFRNCDPHM